MVKLEMEVAGLPDFQVDMQNPDFARVAEAMGIRAITIDDPAHLAAGLANAFGQKGPVLVNVFTDESALAAAQYQAKNGKGNGLVHDKDDTRRTDGRSLENSQE